MPINTPRLKKRKCGGAGDGSMGSASSALWAREMRGHKTASTEGKRTSASSSAALVIDLTDSPPASPKGGLHGKSGARRAGLHDGGGGRGGGGGSGAAQVISLCSSDDES